MSDLGFHPAIAGKAKVDDRPVQTSTQDGSVDHAGPRSAGTLGDRRAPEDQRLGRRTLVTTTPQLRLFSQPDLDAGHAVIEWKI